MVSAWNKFVKKIYDQNKSKPGYKFKDALKDAAPLWKKGQGSASADMAVDTSAKKTKKRGKKRSMSRGRARGMSRGRSRSRGRY
jgi:hypothetical protein